VRAGVEEGGGGGCHQHVATHPREWLDLLEDVAPAVPAFRTAPPERLRRGWDPAAAPPLARPARAALYNHSVGSNADGSMA
jgi:hypothetical protein